MTFASRATPSRQHICLRLPRDDRFVCEDKYELFWSSLDVSEECGPLFGVAAKLGHVLSCSLNSLSVERFSSSKLYSCAIFKVVKERINYLLFIYCVSAEG